MRKGEGKIEVFAVREDILRLLRQGFDIAAIHTKLSAESRLTVRQRQFYNLVRKYVQPLLRDEARPIRTVLTGSGQASQSAPAPAPHPIHSTGSSEATGFPSPLTWDPGRKANWG
ncbi:TraK family protein [Hyphomonas sp. CACIAM 19H1]|uniref:TraK family protein n=1 Tax=Hyphomonas sp. CACIAM 19H1 TaxID=1873716 RepID=UPI0013B05FB0